MRTFLKYAIPVLAVYMLLGGLFAVMLKPPPVFRHFMSLSCRQ